MAIPFIKKFTVDGSYYIYDVNTNQVVEVESEELSLEQISEAQRQQGLFSPFRPEKVLMGLRTAKDIRDFHNKKSEQLLLELSTGCNLFCLYCPVAGKYTTTEYKKSNMSRETMRKAVDFFYENSQNTDNPVVSFYGGEPLIRFKILKETVEYIKNKYRGSNFNFNLTTNGILLEKDIVDFLIENNFFLNVSLDGPEDIHDRYRLCKDGTSSFQVIVKNLRFIRENNLEYYSENVAIKCVLAPPFDQIEKIIEFFSTEELFKEPRLSGKIKASGLNPAGTDFIDELKLYESAKQTGNVYELFDNRFKDAILAGDLSHTTIERKFFESVLYNIARRPFNRLYPHMQPPGACHIGLGRVFVKTNGDFHICERSGDDYKIGHIDTGLDFDQIAYYYRKLEEVLEDCRDCWAICHYERCWIRLGNLEEFKGEKKEQFCQSQKRFIEKAFKLYVSLLKEDPDCLKVLNDEI